MALRLPITSIFQVAQTQALAQWMLADPWLGGTVRLQMQLHKFIWCAQTRGV
ncbi:MAG: hypothetical protein IIB99_13585 [Planctomycetes bacterium]|nr:hypothetical protein [Planctomycetota bacterium]